MHTFHIIPHTNHAMYLAHNIHLSTHQVLCIASQANHSTHLGYAKGSATNAKHFLNPIGTLSYIMQSTQPAMRRTFTSYAQGLKSLYFSFQTQEQHFQTQSHHQC